MTRAEDLMRQLEERGAAFVEQLVDESQSETAFLDFKEVHEAPQKISLVHKNLSRCLSGFANSDGGVVLWGVKVEKHDGVETPVHGGALPDCVAFAKRIEDLVSGRTVPPVKGVRTRALPIGNGPQGYVALFIPAGTEGPYQAIDGNQYLVRVGSSFQPATHGVLAGMFGRTPQPQVRLAFTLGPVLPTPDDSPPSVLLQLRIAVANFGPVVASDCFVSWDVRDLGGKACALKVTTPDSDRWVLDSIDPQSGSSITSPQNRMAPGAKQVVADFSFYFRPPMDGGVEIQLTVGCAGAPIHRHDLFVPSAQLKADVEEALATPMFSFEDRHLFAAKLIGLQGPWERGPVR